MRPFGILAGLSFALFATLTLAAEYNPVQQQPSAAPEVHRLIVKLRSSATSRIQSTTGADKTAQSVLSEAVSSEAVSSNAVSAKSVMQAIATRANVRVTQTRAMRADPDVEFAEVDHVRYPQAMPNDPLFSGQWYLQNAQPASTNAVAAWDTTTGSDGVVIAVLDTGIRYGHTDLRTSTSNRLLPGYDFVSSDPSGKFVTAGDGDGPDADPSDPGDFVSTTDQQNSPFSNCTTSNSSWHGTRTSGMIGALSNNGSGVTGMTWSGWIEPVRVLGKCGGWDSDILTAMLWAAGIHVDGVPDNQFPAKIENLSLGSTGTCVAPYQSAINQVVAKGVLVVVSAGNEGGPVGAPANCSGAMAIAGIRHAGTKVGFSSLGREVALSAPGGNCVNTGAGQPCLFSLDTTSNSGTTTPSTSNFTDQTNTNLGTSFSAPIVSGIAGLMLAVNGNLKSQQLIQRMRQSANPFPVSSDTTIPTCTVPTSTTPLQNAECNCTTTTCGAGMANAAKSVAAALRPFAAVKLSTLTTTPGASITLDASGSAAACNHQVVSYSWATTSGANPGGIAGANTAMATIVAPQQSSYVVTVTVTDEVGKTDTADITVSSTSLSTAAPATAGTNACLTAVTYSAPATPADAPSNSTPTPTPSTPSQSGGRGGGGGGSLDLFLLLFLGLLVCYRPAMRSAVSNQDF
jgi:serine protease